MPTRIKGQVRRSQLISTYGVGAIVAAGDEAFMVAGIDRWLVSRPDIHEPRLQRRLGVQGFVLPPASEGGNDVPVVRFPAMYSCNTCKRLAPHRMFTDFNGNKCGACGDMLIPSRFVITCRKGHIDDFPYFEWVHKGVRPTGAVKHELTIEAGGASASLSDIVISCSCELSSTMYGAFGRDAMKSINKKCSACRPWLGDAEQACDEYPRTLQRGASNVYFAVSRSALSIPPWSEGVHKLLNRHWAMLRAIPENALRPTIEAMGLATGTAYSVDTLVRAIVQRIQGESDGAADTDDASLREQEYEALVNGQQETSREQDFVCVPADLTDDDVEEWFDQVMSVKRLREVRALESFARLFPPTPADPADQRAPLSKSAVDWLPAIEVLGEGVFLRLNEARLAQWEKRKEVRERARRIDDRYASKFRAAGAAPDRDITPRLLLLHALSHILITQWSLDSGYPAASLRERLYVSDVMAGLLIYTATTDAAGSLGGVVAQAEHGRLGQAVQEAIARTAWCSADPLCIEADAAGVDSLNLAACHACLLLPETSCEESNVLLDRGLLVGTPDAPSLGFFADLVDRS